jgi:hypothetical protein
MDVTRLVLRRSYWLQGHYIPLMYATVSISLCCMVQGNWYSVLCSFQPFPASFLVLEQKKLDTKQHETEHFKRKLMKISRARNVTPLTIRSRLNNLRGNGGHGERLYEVQSAVLHTSLITASTQITSSCWPSTGCGVSALLNRRYWC